MANDKLRALLDKVGAPDDGEVQAINPKVDPSTSSKNFQAAEASRVDRHNNPIAAIYDPSFTSILDKKQIPYGQGEPFKNQDGSFSTLAFPTPEHGIQAAKAILSESQPAFNWYASATGKKALEEFPTVKTPQDFSNLSENQKDKFVSLIAQAEGTNKFKYQPKDLKGLLDSVGAPEHEEQSQQEAQQKSALGSGIQYDVRTHQPIGQEELTLGGLTPGTTFSQAKHALPVVASIEAPFIAPMIPFISSLGAGIGQESANIGDVISGKQSPVQGLVTDPLKTIAQYLPAEAFFKALTVAPELYSSVLAGEEGLLGKLPGIGRFFQQNPLKQKIAEQAARGAVEQIPEKLGIGAPKEVKQIVGDSLRETISAPKTGINAQASQAYEAAKNPVLLKYGSQPIPTKQLNNIISTIDDKIASEVNPATIESLNILKKDITPDMTLMDLYKFQKRAQDIISSGGEEAGAIGKIYQPIKSNLNESISEIASPEESKLYSQADKAYAESKDITSRFEKSFNKKIQGFNRPQPGEAIFDTASKDIMKNPSLIDNAIKKHPELQGPLSDIIMTDISNRVGMGADINKIVKFYNLDRLKQVLPKEYYSALTEGIENINKLNPVNKKMAQSKLIIDTILNRNQRGGTGALLGKGLVGGISAYGNQQQ